MCAESSGDFAVVRCAVVDVAVVVSGTVAVQVSQFTVAVAISVNAAADFDTGVSVTSSWLRIATLAKSGVDLHTLVLASVGRVGGVLMGTGVGIATSVGADIGLTVSLGAGSMMLVGAIVLVGVLICPEAKSANATPAE